MPSESGGLIDANPLMGFFLGSVVVSLVSSPSFLLLFFLFRFLFCLARDDEASVGCSSATDDCAAPSSSWPASCMPPPTRSAPSSLRSSFLRFLKERFFFFLSVGSVIAVGLASNELVRAGLCWLRWLGGSRGEGQTVDRTYLLVLG